MKEATVVFPHQLFRYHPGISRHRPVFLVEDKHFFSGSAENMLFHKKKLMLHMASMQAYARRLSQEDYEVHYIRYDPTSQVSVLVETLKKHDVSRIHIADVVDSRLDRRISEQMAADDIKIDWLETPCFLTPKDWFEKFFEGTKHYSQSKFYIAQRKRLQILVDGDKPEGGKWSFDPENRKKIPKDLPIPGLNTPPESNIIRQARIHIEDNFPSHPGTTKNFLYPITHEDAEEWLRDFLENRLALFGDYEDAMVQDQHFLFHSVLTPMLNIGLLIPKEIVDKTLDYARDHKIPMNALEGFIRQIIGWREFMRIIYVLEEKQEKETNFWNHGKTIPQSFYEGETAILPVDEVIKHLLEHAYAHHIERLMILGNFMLLCEFHPDTVYKWFMEMFIDAYDWVMVPNVYGMSQYADGGLITTKPYISSSSYVRKMSDFSQGPWCDVWDGLYWRFIHKHKDFFAGNPRMKVMTFQLSRMDRNKLKDHIKTAEGFLANLT